MYGPEFDPIDFLTKANSIASNYLLWEDDELMKQEEENGFTLTFPIRKKIGSIPYSFGKFILSNQSLIKSQVKVVKELSIVFDDKTLVSYSNEKSALVYILTPKLMRLLSNLEITLYMTKSFSQ